MWFKSLTSIIFAGSPFCPNLLFLHDPSLYRLTAQQFTDIHELSISRHRGCRLATTSNRGVEEWLGLIEDPILDNSTLDRLAVAGYQIVIEGANYWEKLSPPQKLLGGKGKH